MASNVTPLEVEPGQGANGKPFSPSADHEPDKHPGKELKEIHDCHESIIKLLCTNEAKILRDIKNSKTLTVESMAGGNYPVYDKNEKPHNMVYLPYPMTPVAMQRGIIHKVIEAVKAGTLEDQVARHFVKLMVRQDPFQMLYGVSEGNGPLDIAVQYPKCRGMVEALCEYGMRLPPDLKVQPGSVENLPDLNSWMDVSQVNRDTCLHIAIKRRNTNLAHYLLQRIEHDKAVYLLLRHKNQDGLTPLHVAVDYANCDEDQIRLVEKLIQLYPPALEIETEKRPRDLIQQADFGISAPPVPNSYPVEELRRIGGGPVKGGLSPYRYFLDTRTQHQSSVLIADQPPARESPTFFFETPQPDHLEAVKKAAADMEDLLRLSCMRHFSHDRRILTKLLPPQLNQIHFDLRPRMEVSRAFLNQLSKVGGFKFEPFLQYVCIPNLRVHGVRMKELEAEAWWQSRSRKDYVYIFEWLRNEMGVEKIIRMVVEDHPVNFHSDEAIERAVRGFDIENWDWVKPDLCSDTIKEAAKNVQDLCLHWSGNKAVLSSWSASGGLAELRKLRTVRIITDLPTEKMNQIDKKFKDDLKASWEKRSEGEESAKGPPEVKFEPAPVQMNTTKKLLEREREEKGRQVKWLKSIDNFTNRLTTYLAETGLKKEQNIRVAIIDDGLDVECNDLGESVDGAETFYDNQGHWPGFHQSASGHGTLMASLIHQMCPSVRLYIAKLNELWSEGTPQITADSAAKAIDWAREKEVDIISMSWSIEDPDSLGLQALKEAVRLALGNNILLFCSSNDQGNLTDIPYPAKINEKDIFKIGSATALGHRDLATSKAVDFIAPGFESAESGSSVAGLGRGHAEPLGGSSIATARCAGLAALILQCIVLLTKVPREEFRTHGNMKSMFESMVSIQDKDKYLRVWKVFDESFEKAKPGPDLEWNIIWTAAIEFVRRVPFLLPAVNGAGSDN